jgi:hypothetical protein
LRFYGEAGLPRTSCDARDDQGHGPEQIEVDPRKPKQAKADPYWPGRLLVVVAAATLVTGCADVAPLGPEGPAGLATPSAALAGALAEVDTVDLGSCQHLQVNPGNELVTSKGPGVFMGVTFIQRLNTAGGIAPSRDGTLGEEARVPYTTEYLFYRPE